MKEELQKLRAEQAAKKLFTEECASLFVKHPKLESFSWTQYTPYFNDGETCYFGTSTDCPSVTYAGWKHDEDEPYPEADTEGLEQAQADVKATLATLEDDDLRMMFGDHVEVTVTTSGTSVNDYHHD